MIFFDDKNCVCLGAMDHYAEQTTNNIYDAKLLVTWSDIPQTQKNNVELAKELGIPVVIVGHGRNCTTNYDPDYQDVATGQTKYDFMGDKFLVWGEKDVSRLKRGGVADEKISVVGCPLIPCALPEKQNEKAVIFITHHDHSRQDARHANETIHQLLLDKYGKENFSYTIDKVIKTVPKYTMIISPQMDNEDILNVVDDRNFGAIRIEAEDRFAWINMMSALIHAKCVVSPTGGSFEGLAMAMDVPVIRVECDFGYRDKKGDKYTDDLKGVEVCQIDDLVETIEGLDKDKLKAQRKEVAVEEMGIDKLPAIDNIIKEIDQWL